MANEEFVKQIAEWVKEHAGRESILLTPVPVWTVNAHELLDYISSVTGVSKETIGGWVMDNESKNYKVECRIDGKWFGNDLVFGTVEEATEYGAGMVGEGAAERFRLKETTEPVKLPAETV